MREFLKENGYPLEALLLLDNASCHPAEDELQSDDGKIRAMFLPANVTALIQPMDQNMIRLTKLSYRNTLLSKIVNNDVLSIADLLKQFTLLDAVVLLNESWTALQPQTIKKCWENILVTENDPEEDVPLATLRAMLMSEKQANENDLRSSLAHLRTAFPLDNITLCDVDEWNEDICDTDSTDDDEVISDSESHPIIENGSTRKIGHRSALDAAHLLIEWAKENEATESQIENLVALREMSRSLLVSVSAELKQTKISNFFAS